MVTRCQPSMKSGKGHLWQLTAAQQETGENKNADIFWMHFSELFTNAYEAQCQLMNLILLCIDRKKPFELNLIKNWRWWLWYPMASALGSVAACPPKTRHTQCSSNKDCKAQKNSIAPNVPLPSLLQEFCGFSLPFTTGPLWEY